MRELSDTAIHQLTAAILARPEFALAAPQPPFWSAWADRLVYWLQRLQLLHESAPVLYWMIVSGVAAMGIGAIVHTVWTVWVAMHGAPEPSMGRRPAGSRTPDLPRAARELARAGNYLEAAHYLMIASFHTLAEHALIELRPDRSNRWIRTALRQAPLASELADELDTLVVRTEHRWFGGRENEPAIYADWVAAFARLGAELH